MTHFLERKHLIQWLAKNCARKSVVRAMDEGTVELLGSFKYLGRMRESGWIVKVTSDTGKIWYVEIVPWRKRLAIFISDLLPPWEDWDGDNFTNQLWCGDNPAEYARLRDERRAKIEEENRASEDKEQGIEFEGEGT